MTRLEALKELKAKVEAGKLHDIASDTVSDAGLGDFEWAFDDIAEARSLDATLALHEAVLPGWFVQVKLWTAMNGGAVAYVGNDFVASAADPARAWLLAILRALIAQEAAK